jgi:hypothetical protein
MNRNGRPPVDQRGFFGLIEHRRRGSFGAKIRFVYEFVTFVLGGNDFGHGGDLSNFAVAIFEKVEIRPDPPCISVSTPNFYCYHL